MDKYKIKFGLPDYKDLLRYGEIVSDLELNAGTCIRIRKIRYMGILYHLKMVDGEVETLIQWDILPYQEDENDLRVMDDIELARLLMFSDRERKDNRNAERVYWLCVKEINRREDGVE